MQIRSQEARQQEKEEQDEAATLQSQATPFDPRWDLDLDDSLFHVDSTVSTLEQAVPDRCLPNPKPLPDLLTTDKHQFIQQQHEDPSHAPLRVWAEFGYN